MGVYLRPDVKRRKQYYFKTQVAGRRYSGPTGCTDYRSAVKFEGEKVRAIIQEQSARALVTKHRDSLAGATTMTLAECWAAYLKKPRRKPMGPAREKAVASRWGDFVAWCTDNHPRVLRLVDVSRGMAEEYMHRVRTEGRWKRLVEFKRKGHRAPIRYETNLPRLSTAAQNDFLQTCRVVFESLKADSGLILNPFEGIPKVAGVFQPREAFSPEELKLIGARAVAPLRSLFLTAICTGLTEGDICCLRWGEVDIAAKWITCRRRKTNSQLRIPILPGLLAHLEQLPREGEFVYPELAAMYRQNRTGISYRVRKFLHECRISTTKEVTNRTRRTSVKDVHSLRHTFVYLAALHGVPFPIVQSVVGHMSQAMTARYMSHATDEAKTREMGRLPDYLHGDVVPARAKPAPAGDRLASVREIVASMTAESWQDGQLRVLDLLDGLEHDGQPIADKALQLNDADPH